MIINTVCDHPVIMYANFFQKLTFFVCAPESILKMLDFQKILPMP